MTRPQLSAEATKAYRQYREAMDEYRAAQTIEGDKDRPASWDFHARTFATIDLERIAREADAAGWAYAGVWWRVDGVVHGCVVWSPRAVIRLRKVGLEPLWGPTLAADGTVRDVLRGSVRGISTGGSYMSKVDQARALWARCRALERPDLSVHVQCGGDMLPPSRPHHDA